MSAIVIETFDRDFRIHNNIEVLARAKQIKLANYTKLNSTEFRNQSISSGLFTYTGERDGKTFFIVFMSIISKYLKKVDVNRLIDTNDADHYIFILPTRKSFKVDDATKSVEFIIGDESMIAEVPEGFRVQGISHRILGADELDTLGKTFFIGDLETLPKILTSDPGIIYSTAQVGDVVEAVYPTQATSFQTGSLYYVINPPA
jgi:DNA-directed RNA polymerase subunit H (RpoH/RPB5)